MGRVHGDSPLEIKTTNMFRFALLICSVAYATAKADASYGYGGYGGYSHLGYAGYGGPVAHAHSTGPHLPNVVQHVPYGYAASGVYRAANAGALHLAKRSADADADADAFYGYGGYGHLGYAGYGGPVAHAHSTGPHLPNVVQHVPYGSAASGVYRAANAGALPLAKRSADADAFYGYGGYGYAGPVTSGLSTVSHAGFPLQGYAQGYGYGLW